MSNYERKAKRVFKVRAGQSDSFEEKNLRAALCRSSKPLYTPCIYEPHALCCKIVCDKCALPNEAWVSGESIRRNT